MLKNNLPFTFILLLPATLLSLWFFSSIMPTLGIVSLLFSLATAVYAIIEKHNGADNSRVKIAKDALVLVLTLLVIAFLGGLAAMLVNSYVSLSFGAVVGFVSAIIASFAVGYLVKRGLGRLSG